MGKKKVAHKQPSTTGGKHSENATTMEAHPPSLQQSQPASTPQIPAMVLLDTLAANLPQQDPNRDWATTLAGFNQPGRISAVPIPTQEIPTTISPPTTIPTSSTPTSEKSSPTGTAPSASSNPSPIHQQVEPLDISPQSAYQDPDLNEEEEEDSEEEKGSEEKESEEKGKELEETPVTKPIPREKEREEIDLNEMARKQGLMTDDEF